MKEVKYLKEEYIKKVMTKGKGNWWGIVISKCSERVMIGIKMVGENYCLQY